MIFHKILHTLDPTGHYFWSGAYLYGPRVPNIIGKPRILEIELFWDPGSLEILDINQFWDPGSLEILDIQELGVLGSWKYWISTNMVYWVPGYQPTWCTGFLGGTAATAAATAAAASQQLSDLARPLAQGGQEKISRKGNPSLRQIGQTPGPWQAGKNIPCGESLTSIEPFLFRACKERLIWVYHGKISRDGSQAQSG